MDKSFDSVSIVVEHEYNRIQTKLQYIGERLHCEVQAAFTGDKDTSLEVSVLSDGFKRSHSGASGVAN